LGAARSIDKATPASLRQDIVALLGDPTLTRRVAAMRQAFERYDQENVAVTTMERLVGLARSRAKNDPHWFVENRREPATLNL
jgi:UDP:flavonoid glycosyltransferase YjiC (YdhE family)